MPQAPLIKRYYTVAEVADRYNVTKSLVRFWEGEFPTLRPRKLDNGERRFTPADVLHFERIYDLVKVRGFTLAGARDELKLQHKRERERDEIVRELERIRAGLVELRKRLDE